MALGWQERQGHQRPARCCQPPSNAPPIVGQASTDNRSMLPEAPVIRSALRDEHPPGDVRGAPAAVQRDLRREAKLPIERAEHLGDVDELRLQLNNEQRRRRRMPRQRIDDPSLAVDRERHLWHDEPADEGVHPSGERFVHLAMACAKRLVEIAAAPSQAEVDPGIERQPHSMHRVHRQGIGRASFHPRDGRRRDASAPRELGLRPARANSQHPDGVADSSGVHRGSMGAAAYPRLHAVRGRLSA